MNEGNKKEIFLTVLACFFAAMIPVLFIAYGFQTKRYVDLSRDVASF